MVFELAALFKSIFSTELSSFVNGPCFFGLDRLFGGARGLSPKISESSGKSSSLASCRRAMAARRTSYRSYNRARNGGIDDCGRSLKFEPLFTARIRPDNADGHSASALPAKACGKACKPSNDLALWKIAFKYISKEKDGRLRAWKTQRSESRKSTQSSRSKLPGSFGRRDTIHRQNSLYHDVNPESEFDDGYRQFSLEKLCISKNQWLEMTSRKIRTRPTRLWAKLTVAVP